MSIIKSRPQNSSQTSSIIHFTVLASPELLIPILNLHLDRPRLRITRRLERLHRILNPIPMRDKSFRINNPRLHQPYRLRPRIRIPILELQIHLPCTQPHKRNLHLVLPDANDEDLAAELDGLDGAGDAGLDARTFHGDGGLDAFHEREDGGAKVGGGVGELDFVGEDAGDEVFGEGEAARVDVGDDDGGGAGGAAA